MPLWGTDERINIAVEIILKAMRDMPVSQARLNLIAAIEVLQSNTALLTANQREIENALGRKL